MVSVTYVNANGNLVYQKELWVSRLERRRTEKGWIAEGLDSEATQIGIMKALTNGAVEYNISSDEFNLTANTMAQTPWTDGDPESTPAGWMVNLPLPLQWHVHSLASEANLSISITNSGIQLSNGVRAVAHQEKNWAKSFPRAHMWVQAYTKSDNEQDHHSCFCLAGGKVFSFLDAYIFTFQNPSIKAYFRPPWMLSICDLSPFFSTRIDWPARTFGIEAYGWQRQISVIAKASKDTFFNLSAPFPEGHRAKALAQSLNAVVRVRIWQREGWLAWFGLGKWELKTDQTFENAGLEFGGEYYGDFERKLEA